MNGRPGVGTGTPSGPISWWIGQAPVIWSPSECSGGSHQLSASGLPLMAVGPDAGHVDRRALAGRALESALIETDVPCSSIDWPLIVTVPRGLDLDRAGARRQDLDAVRAVLRADRDALVVRRRRRASTWWPVARLSTRSIDRAARDHVRTAGGRETCAPEPAEHERAADVALLERDQHLVVDLGQEGDAALLARARGDDARPVGGVVVGEPGELQLDPALVLGIAVVRRRCRSRRRRSARRLRMRRRTCRRSRRARAASAPGGPRR